MPDSKSINPKEVNSLKTINCLKIIQLSDGDEVAIHKIVKEEIKHNRKK